MLPAPGLKMKRLRYGELRFAGGAVLSSGTAGGGVETFGGVAGVAGEADGAVLGVIVSGFAALVRTPSLAEVWSSRRPVAVRPSFF